MKLYFKFKKLQPALLCVILIFTLLIFIPFNSIAQDNGHFAPTLTGFSVNSGYTYDPSNTSFVQVSFFKLFDYDKVWPHAAPENLRFKVEASLGGAYWQRDSVRLIANVEMLALYYVDILATKKFKPYIEGGIGVIFTDYRVEDQAYRINFNPQAGIGVEISRKKKGNCFIAVRAHHLSNSGINSSNRGQNSIVFMFGQYF